VCLAKPQKMGRGVLTIQQLLDYVHGKRGDTHQFSRE
jgi:hypothetical protein